MDTDVQDYDWMLTIKQKVDINGNSSNIRLKSLLVKTIELKCSLTGISGGWSGCRQKAR